MTEIPISIFASKEYALLAWLSEHQTDTRDGPIIPFSQDDLSKEYQRSIATTNKMMQALCDSGCLEKYKKRGKYRITETGQAVIAKMHEIEQLVGGTQNGK